jgi:dihydrofolate synthase/folylpolyglutamate synthase
MVAYQNAVSELYQLGHELYRAPSYKFDLRYMRVLCQALGSPDTRFRSVLIAGTNGKGSTAATLASILRCAGYRAGLYTSPHLVRINERIRIDGEPVSDAHFAAAYDHVRRVASSLVAEGGLPWHPSFFETITALAFEHFARQGIEIAVVEVGMGGRLDATNVLEPLISVISDIDLDHQMFLGNTIAEIAAEKAGIMRRGRPLITLPQHPEANATLDKAILESGALPINAARYVASLAPQTEELVNSSRRAGGRASFAMEVMGEEVEIAPALAGRHQLRNLALAISAAEELRKLGYKISPQQVAEGVRLTRWPGRFQVLEAESPQQTQPRRLPGAPEPGSLRPETVLDVAHNPAGAWALRAGLSENIFQAGSRPLVMVFGAMRDKAIREMARILFPLAESVVLCQPVGNPRAATTAELAEAAGGCGVPLAQVPEVRDAIREASTRARQLGPDPLLVITGSIYVVGEAMQALKIVP